MIHVNTGNLRYGASRFSGGAVDLRMRAGRLKNAATQLGGRWSGEASRAFFQAVEIVLRDLDKAAGFLEQANTAMNQLAWTMEQVERIRQQIQNLEWELSSLSGEEHQHERSQVRSHIRQLQLQADTESNQADYTAAQAFHRILGDLHSLHFYDPDKSWWQEALDGLKTGWKAVKGFGDGVEEAIVDTVVGITDAIVHLDKTMEGIGNLVLHPIDSGSAIWQQVTDSWERDVTNGDAYSGGKWWGNAVGQIVLSLAGTKGADKVAKGLKAAQAGEVVEEAAVAAKATEAVEETSNVIRMVGDEEFYSSSNLAKLVGESAHSDLAAVLKQHNIHMTPEEFKVLRNKQLEHPGELTEAEWATLKKVRESFPIDQETVMQKVITQGDVLNYVVTKKYKGVQGFVARYQDVKDIPNASAYKQELRLDYNNPNNPFGEKYYNKDWQNPYLNADGTFKEGPIYAIRFKASSPDRYHIPYIEDVTRLKESWPCTGDGFLGGDMTIPELKIDTSQMRPLEGGDSIYIIGEDGTEELVAFVNEFDEWEISKGVPKIGD
ncbi:WXG100 family type VII secretion target [Tumebacillus sp. ITR2]|uniref:WXG100 family type VII secretion target n=1 Tax=Tumebacillus amylolyticus TaxID=2801339 RepID=A0ABS1JGU0_9BACL|nr:WXG100 family type VII secretion target [Tumebacillus amylolyticus]